MRVAANWRRLDSKSPKIGIRFQLSFHCIGHLRIVLMHSEWMTWRMLIVKVAVSLGGAHCLDVAFWSYLYCFKADFTLNEERTRFM